MDSQTRILWKRRKAAWVQQASRGLGPLLLLCSVSIGGCKSWPKGDGGSMPTAPALSVSLGFGAVSATPYQCVGSGKVELLLNGAQVLIQEYSFGGYSGSSPPACQTALTFSNLVPAMYLLRDPATGRSCSKNIGFGLNQTSIRLDAGWVCG
jgi:hypothetical protein